jgi:serralysin
VNTLTGGLGNDIYVLSNAADSVMENPGEGTDTVQFAGNFNGISFVLPANVENAINIGSVSLTVTGNSLGNTLIGGAGAEIFNGMLGNDTLNGNDGFDIATYSGSKGSYTITPNLGIFAVTDPTATTQ